MTSPALAVPRWSEARPISWSGEALLVFSLDTPHTTQREAARQRIRLVLSEILAPWLGCSAAEVPLVSQPGHALKLAVPGRTIGLSVSHAPGISLAAIHPDSAIGIDVQRLSETAIADDEMLRLTNEYLGPEMADALARQIPANRATAFAKAWVGFEARLKCRGEALMEWSPARQTLLDADEIRPLRLPAGLVGAIAIAARKQ